ncbi:MAG: nitronate monooxygenase, partial [Myxococcota bacterium]
MHTRICDRLEIEFPIFAFSHCRDVVAAVSQAGGFGVIGALGFTADELEVELEWIDARVGDRPYGIDVVMPSFREGRAQGDPREFEQRLAAMIPEEHRAFVARLMEEHGVPDLPEGERPR